MRVFLLLICVSMSKTLIVEPAGNLTSRQNICLLSDNAENAPPEGLKNFDDEESDSEESDDEEPDDVECDGEEGLAIPKLLDIVWNRFRFCYEIGSGGFGTVWAAEEIQNDRPVAVKVVACSNVKKWIEVEHEGEKSKKMPAEIVLHSKVSSVEGVNNLIEYLVDESGDYFLITARPKNSINLYDFITERDTFFDDEVSRCFFFQIVQTVVKCHRLGVVHRDLKGKNLLVDLETGKLKLIDFGSGAKWQSEPYQNRSLGTTKYNPPEYHLTNKTFDPEKGTAWSLGVLLFELLYGDIPFLNKESILKRVIRWKSFKRKSPLSDMAHDLLWYCLNKDPAKRPTTEQILEHPWLQAKCGANFSTRFQKYATRIFSKTNTSTTAKNDTYINTQCVGQQQRKSYANINATNETAGEGPIELVNTDNDVKDRRVVKEAGGGLTSDNCSNLSNKSCTSNLTLDQMFGFK